MKIDTQYINTLIKKNKMKKVNYKLLFSYIFCSLLTLFLNSCNTAKHETKDSVSLEKYKGCIVSGKQFDWDSSENGAELITFKRGNHIWTESYLRSVWELYEVGDTIK